VRRFGEDWQVGLDYRYSDNDSSDAAFTYERNRVAIGASRAF
jgi:hypothetical protein